MLSKKWNVSSNLVFFELMVALRLKSTPPFLSLSIFSAIRLKLPRPLKNTRFASFTFCGPSMLTVTVNFSCTKKFIMSSSINVPLVFSRKHTFLFRRNMISSLAISTTSLTNYLCNSGSPPKK